MRFKKRRVFFLFFLGIALPCLILGYMAFRGIQNDQALLEKRRLEDYNRWAQQIFQSANTHFQQAESAFISIVSEKKNARGFDYSSRLRELNQKFPLIEEVFFFEKPAEIDFPGDKLLYISDGSSGTPADESGSTTLDEQIQRARQLEFNEKKISSALRLYQTLVKQSPNSRQQGELFMAVARLQKRAKQFNAAITSYEQIIQNHGRARTRSGIPLGPAASRELGLLYLEMDKPETAGRTLLKCYSDLINGAWLLERAQFDFFSSSLKELIKKIPAVKIGSLESEEIRKRERTERCLTFAREAAESLRTSMSPDTALTSGLKRRKHLESGGSDFLYSWFILSDGSGAAADEIYGLIFDHTFLSNNLLKKALETTVTGEKSEWFIRGGDDQLIQGSAGERPPGTSSSTDFPGNFPEWSLGFYPAEQNPLKTFLTSGSSLYFYIFLLIGAMLVFGLVFTIRTVNQQLELARMKSDFVSTISHEFKSPLTAIRQMAEMLQAGRIPSNERRQKYYDVLMEQSERLTLLTENVLDLAKIEEGKKEYQFKPTDITPLLEEMVGAIRDRIGHEGFEIQLKMEKSLPRIDIDIAAFNQSFSNLVNNAIKYSERSKKIVVIASSDSEHLTVAVQDFGIGIKREDIGRIFERFYRGGDALTRTVKGSGLGLTLVRQIMNAHGGRVEVDSIPGEGSTFSIKFPHKQERGQT